MKTSQKIWDTISVEKAQNDVLSGVYLSSYLNPFFEPNKIDLKKNNLAFNYTIEEIEEVIKCKDDVMYFAENYCKIKTEDGTYKQAKLRDYQKDILNNFKNNRFNVVLASRQQGKTIMTAIFILHYCFFNNKKNVMMVANKGKTVVEVINKIKEIYRSVPFFLKRGIVSWKERGIEFDNGTRILTENRVKEPSVGFSIDFLYCDEFALIPENFLNTYWENIWPVVSSIENSRAIITSTPKGFNLFYDLVRRAGLPPNDPEKNEFKLSIAYWWQIPGRLDLKVKLNKVALDNYGVTQDEVWNKIRSEGFKKIPGRIKDGKKYPTDSDGFHRFKKDEYDLNKVRNMIIAYKEDYPIRLYQLCTKVTNWKADQIANFKEEAFARQFDLKFSTGSDLLFKNETLEKLNKNKRNFEHISFSELDKILPFKYDDLIWIKDHTILNMSRLKDYSYVVSVDVGDGLGRDYSVINIFKLARYNDDELEIKRKSAESFHDLFKMEQVGVWCNNTANHEEVAYILHGIIFKLLNPENVKVTLEINGGGGRVLDALPKLYKSESDYASYVMCKYKHASSNASKKIGLKIRSDNKPHLARYAKTLVENGDIVLYHNDTIKEMGMFVIKETPSGNTQFTAQTGNDDLVMTILGAAATRENKPYWEALTETEFSKLTPEEKSKLEGGEFLKNTTSVDYSGAINAYSNVKRGMFNLNQARFSKYRKN
jgi:hypothetical protein